MTIERETALRGTLSFFYLDFLSYPYQYRVVGAAFQKFQYRVML